MAELCVGWGFDPLVSMLKEALGDFPYETVLQQLAHRDSGFVLCPRGLKSFNFHLII